MFKALLCSAFLSTLLLPEAEARRCSQIFESPQSMSVAFSRNYELVRESLTQNKRDLLPHNIEQTNMIYSKNFLEKIRPHKFPLTKFELDLILRSMTAQDVLFLTPIGPSIWKRAHLRDWFYLGETNALVEKHTAQIMVEHTLPPYNNRIPGITPKWVNALKQSSRRMTDAKKQAAKEISHLFPPPHSKNKALSYSNSLFTTMRKIMLEKYYEHRHFEFAWGSNFRSLDTNRMEAESALEVIRTLALLTLIENTLYISHGQVRKIGEADFISPEAIMVMAHQPQLVSLVDLFAKIEMDVFDPNFNKIGGIINQIPLVHDVSRKDVNEISYFAAFVEGDLSLSFTKNSTWTEPNVNKLAKLVNSSIGEVLWRSHPNAARSPVQRSWLEFDADHVNVNLQGLSIREKALTAVLIKQELYKFYRP